MSHRPAAPAVIAPVTQDVIIRQRPDGRREVVPSRWGLLPQGLTDPRSLRHPLIHARAENLTSTPSFQPLLTRNRCVVPLTGFYEWQGSGAERRKFLLRRGDGEPLSLAALWDTWEHPQTRAIVTSHVLIMCPANATLTPLTERMPVVLERADLDRWLDQRITDRTAVLSLLVPCPEDVLMLQDVTERGSRRGRRAAARAYTLPLPL